MTTGVKDAFNNELRAIRILFYAMFAGVIFFSGVCFALGLSLPPAFDNPSIEKMLLGIMASAAAVCFILAKSLYTKNLNKIIALALPLPDKLINYRAALVKYLALCEGSAMFPVIAFFLTGNNYFFIITVAMLLAMLLKRPSRQGIITELQLSSQEQSEIA